MQPSPLELLSSAVESVSLRADDSYVGEAGRPLTNQVNLQVDTSIALLGEDGVGQVYGIRLQLKALPKSAGSTPYTAEMGVRGTFLMHKIPAASGPDALYKLALVNGTSFLFGMCRELLATISSRATHGMFTLPTMSFAGLAEQQPSKTVDLPWIGETTAKKVARKKAPAKRATGPVRSRAT